MSPLGRLCSTPDKWCPPKHSVTNLYKESGVTPKEAVPMYQVKPASHSIVMPVQSFFNGCADNLALPFPLASHAGIVSVDLHVRICLTLAASQYLELEAFVSACLPLTLIEHPSVCRM